MNLSKWRIRKRGGKWRIFMPGRRFDFAGNFDTFQDAIEFLPKAQRWVERNF